MLGDGAISLILTGFEGIRAFKILNSKIIVLVQGKFPLLILISETYFDFFPYVVDFLRIFFCILNLFSTYLQFFKIFLKFVFMFQLVFSRFFNPS